MKVDKFIISELISAIENTLDIDIVGEQLEELERSLEITLAINVPSLNIDEKFQLEFTNGKSK